MKNVQFIVNGTRIQCGSFKSLKRMIAKSKLSLSSKIVCQLEGKSRRMFDVGVITSSFEGKGYYNRTQKKRLGGGKGTNVTLKITPQT